ncbi:hypothetical protein H6F67_02585 [Microcoleus sp. FACHB-1515]|uniref:hypothetical protein n=1 Tax=Cyanophyceae TaxID=3028117 RepID=UPI0016864026|nr:hypothetical protein [Microcoleus sp. FACHB-1515]MBD2088749.1 hypothetical protein [Microcoleus sp. FACHB-1515]
MTTQDVFFPIIAAIAGWFFGAIIGGALPCLLVYTDPARARRGDAGLLLAIEIYGIWLSVVGCIIGSALNLFLCYIGASLVYLLIAGFILAALSSLLCPNNSGRWNIIRGMWLVPILVFFSYVLKPIYRGGCGDSMSDSLNQK